MTTTLVTLTGDVTDAIGTDFDPRRTKAYVRHNTPKIVTDEGPIHLGGGTVNVAADGTFTLPNVVASTSLVENLQATVYVDYEDRTTRQRATATFGPYDLSAETGPVDVRDLEAAQALDPSFASETMAAMQQLLAEMQEISGLTGEDDAVALLINTPSSDTAASIDHVAALGAVDVDTELGFALAGTFLTAAFPEKYGPGYDGSDPDDWGPAITEAIAEATTRGVHVHLNSRYYDIQTEVTWPTGSRVQVFGRGESTILRKAADVTLLNSSGTSSQREYGRVIHNVQLDGGNNSGWSAPLLKNDYTSRSGTRGCVAYQNHGPAISSRCAWDTLHDNPNIIQCGGNSLPAVRLWSDASDGGSATNNQWLVNARIESSRVGSIWAKGADSGSTLFGIKLVGNAKIELSAGHDYYGPGIVVENVKEYQQDAVQFTLNGGAVAAGQTRPFPAFMRIAGSQQVQLGRMYGNIGNVLSGDVSALIHFDGSTTANSVVSWQDFALAAGSGTSTDKPAAVFKWSGTNNFVSRGATRWNSNFWTVPTDDGSPTSTVDVPVIATVTDSNFAAAAGRVAVDGDRAFDSTDLTAKTRVSGTWRRAVRPPVIRKDSGRADPDPAGTVFGSAKVFTPRAGSAGLNIIEIGADATGIGAEAITFKLVATYDDGTTSSDITPAFANWGLNSSTTSSWARGVLYSIAADGKTITSLSVYSKASGATSAQVTIRLAAIN